MNSLYLELVCIIFATSIACALPGFFLVTRGMALMSDALSHALLPGIVIMFLFTQSLSSPLLIIGAALAGGATVLLIEHLVQTKYVKKEAAIGLVFPLFFSVGVLLISYYARSVHLDMDIVILGHLIFTPFERLIINNYDYGPQALWIMTILALGNTFCIVLVLKELTLATFDPVAATISGFRPKNLHYLLMGICSITCVCAFNAVGSIVVIALMIVPAATALLLATTVHQALWLTLFFGCCATWAGLLFAHAADVSIAGSIALMTGVFLCLGYGLSWWQKKP